MIYWTFTPWFPYDFDEKTLAGSDVVNGWDVMAALQPAGTVWKDFPVAQLEIKSESFDIDCFTWDGMRYVSEKLRDALDLPENEVQYFEVDSSRSAPLVRSKNYKIMNVCVTDEVSDLDGSDYSEGRLTPDSPLRRHSVESIAIRPDAVSRYEVFQERNFIAHTLCADDLAMRVLKAGCTGVRFRDPATLSLTHTQRFRTLRGIEEEGEWDSVNKIEHTTLIEAIDLH
jgi:hypothetical protein